MTLNHLEIQLHQQRLFEQSCLEFYTRYDCTDAPNTAGRCILSRCLKQDYGTETFMASLPGLCAWFEEREEQARERVRAGQTAVPAA